MDHGVPVHGTDKLGLLLFGGKLAIKQQIAGFEIVRLFGQLLDGVAPVQENALAAVDKGNLRFACGGGHKTGIKGKHSFAGETADIQHIRPQGARVNREIN